jgi:hypothetical protein
MITSIGISYRRLALSRKSNRYTHGVIAGLLSTRIWLSVEIFTPVPAKHSEEIQPDRHALRGRGTAFNAISSQ